MSQVGLVGVVVALGVLLVAPEMALAQTWGKSSPSKPAGTKVVRPRLVAPKKALPKPKPPYLVDLLLVGSDINRAEGLTKTQRGAVRRIARNLKRKPSLQRGSTIGAWLNGLPASARKPAADALLGTLIVEKTGARLPGLSTYLTKQSSELLKGAALRRQLGCKEGTGGTSYASVALPCTATKKSSRMLTLDKRKLVGLVDQLGKSTAKPSGRPTSSVAKYAVAAGTRAYVSILLGTGESSPHDDRSQHDRGSQYTEEQVKALQRSLEQRIDEARARLGKLYEEYAASIAMCVFLNPAACVVAGERANEIAEVEALVVQLLEEVAALFSLQRVEDSSSGPSSGSSAQSGRADESAADGLTD